MTDASHPEKEDTAAIRILLVEDDRRLAELRAALFEKFGASVEVALTAGDALNAITSDASIDLIVTDINLSADPTDRAGFDLARTSRHLRPQTPVVGYSAVASEHELREADEFALVLTKASLSMGQIEEGAEEIVELGRRARET